MRIVIALGGHTLHRRGEKAGAQAQACNIGLAAAQLARAADGNELVIVHGDGPQARLLASQDGEVRASADSRHDVPDAEAERMMAGHRLESELRDRLAGSRLCEALLTMIEVDAADPAFAHPAEPIGAMFEAGPALAAARAKGWSIVYDGVGYRRAVPSPRPVRLVQLQPLRWLLDHGAVVICGGGIPVVAADDGSLHRVEALIDKDRSAALVAEAIDADLFIIATDVAGVFLDWGTANSKLLRHALPSALREFPFAACTMGPKVEAASRFAERTGRRATIGSLSDVMRLVAGTAGTSISCEHVDPRSVMGGSVAC